MQPFAHAVRWTAAQQMGADMAVSDLSTGSRSDVSPASPTPARLWGPRRTGATTTFRLWAPAASHLSLRLGDTDLPMSAAGGGWYEITCPAPPGTAYAFVLPDGTAVPDPAARQQAGPVSGPSLVTDDDAYRWRTAGWSGRPWAEAVILELHVGTFTPEGTFAAAAAGVDWFSVPGMGVSMVNAKGDSSWPISTASFILMHKQPADKAQSAEVLKFFDWAFKNGKQMAAELDYVALPDSLTNEIRSKVWSQIAK